MASSAFRSASKHRAAAASALRCCLNPATPRLSHVPRFRALLTLADRTGGSLSHAWRRCFSTSRTASSLNDPSPNWSNRPPKETILLDGCDFEHWLVVVDPPDPNLTRDEIIKSYIQTLAKVVGSEEDARMKIYSVSTKHYFAFGALVSEELSYKIKEIPGVRWVLPDSYLDVKNKDYGGEPFINGEAVPYDPKYHEEWVRNNARAQERNRRNDRTRERSRNFERRRENAQNFMNRPVPPMQNQDAGNQAVQHGAVPPAGNAQNFMNRPVPPMQNQDAGNQAMQHGAVPPAGNVHNFMNKPVPPMQNQDGGNQAVQHGAVPPAGTPPWTTTNTGAQPGGYQHQMPVQSPAHNTEGSNQYYGGYQNAAPNFPGSTAGNVYQGGSAPAGGGPYQGGPGPSGGPCQGGPGPAGSFPYQGGPGPAGSFPYQGGPSPSGGSYQGETASHRGPNQGGDAHLGNRNVDQGHRGYLPPHNTGQSSPGGFQGPPNNYQGNPGPYQGTANNYQGYQGNAYNHQGNPGGYRPGVTPRDVPGRDD